MSDTGNLDAPTIFTQETSEELDALAVSLADAWENRGADTTRVGEGFTTDDVVDPALLGEVADGDAAADESAEAAVEPAAEATAETSNEAPVTDVSVETPGETPGETATPDDASDNVSEPAQPTGYRYQTFDASGTPVVTEVPDVLVQQALGLHAWASGLTDEVRTTISAVESGQAVAISREEYDQFAAWRNQQSATQRDADLADLDIDPDVAEVIKGLRDQVQQLGGQVPGQVPGGANTTPATPTYAPTPDNSAAFANLSALESRFDQSIATYASNSGLSEEEAGMVLQRAIDAGVLPALSEQHTQVNPVTGQALGLDVDAVVSAAMNFGLASDRALMQRVAMNQAAAQNSNVHVLPQAPQSTNEAEQATDQVAVKRARSASLASAPSAAVAPAPRGQLNREDKLRGMADLIQQELAK